MEYATGLVTYVQDHTVRGECGCGRYSAHGAQPDPESNHAHTADLIFFRVALNVENPPTAEEFSRLAHEHQGDWNRVDVFDGNEHNYIELGGWLGDQGIALQFMGLAQLLGSFELLTPVSVLGCTREEAMSLAGMGMVTIRANS